MANDCSLSYLMPLAVGDATALELCNRSAESPFDLNAGPEQELPWELSSTVRRSLTSTVVRFLFYLSR
jgi:hypothetical protein